MTTQDQLPEIDSRGLPHEAMGGRMQAHARQLLAARTSTCSNEYIAARNALMHALACAIGRASQINRFNS